jgi:hypothetical protein
MKIINNYCCKWSGLSYEDEPLWLLIQFVFLQGIVINELQYFVWEGMSLWHCKMIQSNGFRLMMLYDSPSGSYLYLYFEKLYVILQFP